jgi:hypothetical protein
MGYVNCMDPLPAAAMNTPRDRGQNVPANPPLSYRFVYRFVVPFNGTLGGTNPKSMVVLRTIGAREEQRALARRTGAGGGIAGRFRSTPPDVVGCRRSPLPFPLQQATDVAVLGEDRSCSSTFGARPAAGAPGSPRA